MDELSPWNEATNFRLDEVACLIVGRQPLSNRRNPDREDLPGPAVPILVHLSGAYLGWLIHRDRPENPQWPKKQQLHGIPNFDGSQRTLLQVVGDKPSRDLRRICWEHVDRAEIARWLQAVQMPSKFDFSPYPCGQAATSTPAPAGTETADEVQAKPLQRFAAQEATILAALRAAGHDPLMLRKNLPGKPGVKAEIRAALVGMNDLFQKGGTTFDKTWERLRLRGGIADKA